ncbi:DUF2860 family protein [Deferribacteraceae bacterium V6Fe1]|nr:DUF2860 family protein [Deferribacteraceae bacterium V6Fe1]
MTRFLIVLLIFAINNLYAETKIGIGSIFTATKSNFETSGNDYLSKYDKPGSYNNDTIPIGELNISKRYGDSSISGGIGYSGDARGLFISGKKKMENYGDLKAQIFIDPFKKGWKNPYQLNSKREETDIYTYGLNFELNKVMNSNFLIKYNLKYMDVRKDDVNYSILKRDAIFKDFIVGYNIKTKIRGLLFIPEASFNASKAKGESNSYYGYGAGFSSLYFKRNLKLIFKINLNKKYYQDNEPIFGKKRSENSYNLMLICNFDDPLGFEKTYLTLTAGYSEKYSNIGFYEESKIFSGIILGYKF